MTSKKSPKQNNFLREYLYQILIASGIAAVVMPYVWVTNLTAEKVTIILHTLLMWIFLPIIITTIQFITSSFNLKAVARFAAKCTSLILSIILAACLTVLIFHKLTLVPYDVLIAPPLYAALMPLFTTYLLIGATRLWREEQNLQLKLASQRDKATFAALSAQIKPHFFFNSLNTLEYLVLKSPQDAIAGIRSFANIYRSFLEKSEHNLIIFEDEIQLAKDYLKIQKFRFNERLNLLWSIDPDSLNSKVPPNLLLNLIENSIKYGVEATTEKSTLKIAAKIRTKDQLLIIVTNDFDTELAPKTKGSGFGHHDLKTRLQLLYGARAYFETAHKHKEYEVRIGLPNEK